jgi:hypothetical protein
VVSSCVVSSSLFLQYQRLTGSPLSELTVCGQNLQGNLPGQGSFSLDFNSPQSLARMRDVKRTSLLKRLDGLLNPDRRVLDLTMGFAQDDREFAQLDFNVFAQERNPIVFCLTLDAFLNQLGTSEDGKAEWLASQPPGWILIPRPQGIAPRGGSLSIRFSAQLEDLDPLEFSFAYYDPMFSEEERSALPKKNIQFLLKTVGHDADQNTFFQNVAARGFSYIVVKRQAGADPIVSTPRPQRQYQTKLVRLDVYSRS